MLLLLAVSVVMGVLVVAESLALFAREPPGQDCDYDSTYRQYHAEEDLCSLADSRTFAVVGGGGVCTVTVDAGVGLGGVGGGGSSGSVVV